jgi:hypothetical protein
MKASTIFQFLYLKVSFVDSVYHRFKITIGRGEGVDIGPVLKELRTFFLLIFLKDVCLGFLGRKHFFILRSLSISEVSFCTDSASGKLSFRAGSVLREYCSMLTQSRGNEIAQNRTYEIAQNRISEMTQRVY